jgi:hypothetical protein
MTIQLDLAGYVGGQPAVAGVDPARLQRAAKSAGQSPAGRGHDIIQCRGMRRILLRGDFIVDSNLRVHAENHRLGFSRQVCQPNRAALPFDTHL